MAVLTATCAALVAAAQEQPAPPAFRSSVNYVRVDAYPTRNGAPVTDLTRDDFEIFESDKPQTIEHFEHVSVQGSVPEDIRREPNSLQESREAVQNPRARVFVIFLDTNFVDPSGSFAVRRPLIDALDRLIGPDDLYAAMTPQMSARDITFARRTATLANELTRRWDWGRRGNRKALDPRERDCEVFNATNPQLVGEAMDRRRERQTLSALADLIDYLRLVREERKAVIAITSGWVLYGPNPHVGLLREGCGRDVTMIDHKREFLRLVGKANRANASFYPLDPRGIAVVDQPVTDPLTGGPGSPLSGFHNAASPDADAAHLQARVSSLRSLADGTDGLALIGSNDLSGSFKRIVDDLSSYYLLGYYSSIKPDGRFHPIKVHVKRPGVRVRARTGYLAADASVAAPAVGSVPVAPGAEEVAAAAAIAQLDAYAHASPLRLRVAAGWKPGEPPSPAVWVAGELSGEPDTASIWKRGATASVDLAGPAAESLADVTVTLAPGTRSFVVSLQPRQPLPPGELLARVTVRGTDEAVPLRDSVGFQLPSMPGAVGALWYRRGPSTGNLDMPAADVRFRKGEQLRLEVPVFSGANASARLLDRTGKPLPAAIAPVLRIAPDGSRWLTVQLSAAPFAPGDYVIELSDGVQRMVAAFKVLP